MAGSFTSVLHSVHHSFLFGRVPWLFFCWPFPDISFPFIILVLIIPLLFVFFCLRLLSLPSRSYSAPVAAIFFTGTAPEEGHSYRLRISPPTPFPPPSTRSSPSDLSLPPNGTHQADRSCPFTSHSDSFVDLLLRLFCPSFPLLWTSYSTIFS